MPRTTISLSKTLLDNIKAHASENYRTVSQEIAYLAQKCYSLSLSPDERSTPEPSLSLPPEPLGTATLTLHDINTDTDYDAPLIYYSYSYNNYDIITYDLPPHTTVRWDDLDRFNLLIKTTLGTRLPVMSNSEREICEYIHTTSTDPHTLLRDINTALDQNNKNLLSSPHEQKLYDLIKAEMRRTSRMPYNQCERIEALTLR